MARESRIIGGMVVHKPGSVAALEKIRARVASGQVEEALKLIDHEIESRWIVEGFWRQVRLQIVTDDE